MQYPSCSSSWGFLFHKSNTKSSETELVRAQENDSELNGSIQDVSSLFAGTRGTRGDQLSHNYRTT